MSSTSRITGRLTVMAFESRAKAKRPSDAQYHFRVLHVGLPSGTAPSE